MLVTNQPWTLLVGDSRELRHALPPVDAVVTDPPYGMGWDTNSKRYSGRLSSETRPRGTGRHWPAIRRDDEPFDPAPWLTYPKVVLWGANHYASRLPVGTSLVWLKKDDRLFGSFLSDAEIGWMKGGYGVYCYRQNYAPMTRRKEGGGAVLHPAQKPIGLMRWCIRRLRLPPNSLILDPYAGSGTMALAAMAEGHRCLMIEEDEHYAEVIRRRLTTGRTLFE